MSFIIRYKFPRGLKEHDMHISKKYFFVFEKEEEFKRMTFIGGLRMVDNQIFLNSLRDFERFIKISIYLRTVDYVKYDREEAREFFEGV